MRAALPPDHPAGINLKPPLGPHQQAVNAGTAGQPASQRAAGGGIPSPIGGDLDIPAALVAMAGALVRRAQQILHRCSRA
jgi:hypothetical protein